MRNAIKGLTVAAVMVVAGFASPSAAKAFSADEYTGNGAPQFNIYTAVPNIGNERDFAKVGIPGSGSANFTNNLNLCEGEVKMTVYVHNGAPKEYNGTNNNGTGVAHGTKVAVTVPTGDSKNQEVSAVISANGVASVSDKATVSCASHDIQLDYVESASTVVTEKTGSRALADSIVSGGALVGTYANDGVVPGCWEFRNYVTLTFKVKKQEKPVVPTAPKPPVTTTTTPTPKPAVLAATGPGDMIAAFTGVTVAGAAAHNLYSRRKTDR